MGICDESPEDPCRCVDDDVVPTLEPAASSRGHALGWNRAKTAPPGSWIGVYVPAGPSAGVFRTLAPSFFAFFVGALRSSTCTYRNPPQCFSPCGPTQAHI